jgi:hypothetical protein
MMKELIDAEKKVTEETRQLLVSLDEKQKKTDRISDKYSQHKKVRVRPTNIYSRKANRERPRNPRHVVAVINQQRLSKSNQTNIQDRHRSEEYYHQHSKVCRSSC